MWPSMFSREDHGITGDQEHESTHFIGLTGLVHWHRHTVVTGTLLSLSSSHNHIRTLLFMSRAYLKAISHKEWFTLSVYAIINRVSTFRMSKDKDTSKKKTLTCALVNGSLFIFVTCYSALLSTFLERRYQSKYQMAVLSQMAYLSSSTLYNNIVTSVVSSGQFYFVLSLNVISVKSVGWFYNIVSNISYESIIREDQSFMNFYTT